MAAVAEERRTERRRGAARKLLVLDINGLLLDTYFHSEKRPPRVHDTKLAKIYVYKRPHCDRFVKFCLQNFLVAVWSSAKEHNVNNLVNYVFGESKKDLVFSWSQSHCTNSGMFCLENRFKPLFFKELSKVWECSIPEVPWNKGQYGPWNTLLIDDSPHKILRNPDHTAILPLAFSAASVQEDDFLLSLESYLERLLHTDNVQKFVKLNPFGQPQLSARSPNWQFYLKAKLSVTHCAGEITKQAELKLQSEKEGAEAQLRVQEQQTTKHTNPESSHVVGAKDLVEQEEPKIKREQSTADMVHAGISDEEQEMHKSRRIRKQSAGDKDLVHVGISDEEKEMSKTRRIRKQSTGDKDLVQAAISDEEKEMRKSRRIRNREQRRTEPEPATSKSLESRRSAKLKHVHSDGVRDETSRRGRQRTEATESEQVHQKARGRCRPWVSLPRFERHRVLWYREHEAYDRRPGHSYQPEYDYSSRGAQNRRQDRYESEYDHSSRGTQNRRQKFEYDNSSRGTQNRRQDRYESEYDYSSRGNKKVEYDYTSRGTRTGKRGSYEPEYDYSSRGTGDRYEPEYRKPEYSSRKSSKGM